MKRKLKIFDFDDTLAKSETPIIVKRADGTTIKLMPWEFATYQEQPNDIFDFTYFNKIITSAQPIKHNIDLLQKYLNYPTKYKVTILTARSLAFPIRYWLKKMTGQEVYVVAVAGSNPKLKADYIEKEIRKGYTDVFFMDDSLANVTAIKNLQKKYPNVKINSIVAEDQYLNKIQDSLNEEDPCWTGYKQIGMKKKRGKKVPNCVPIKKESMEESTLCESCALALLEDIALNNEQITEAEYQGRTVNLNKPMKGDVKKYKVYVKKGDKVVKVNFGDPNMSIKRDNPERKKSFRARHKCDQKKDKTSAGYWSCRMWSSKPVSQILKGK